MSANHALIVSVVGMSGSGKTTFLEKLVPALKDRGLRVGVLKHHGHLTPFDMPGKDTFRHFQAGADVVVGASAAQVAIFRRQDGVVDLAEVIASTMAGVDLVLTEGYKRGPYPKIEIHRAAHNPDLLCDPAELLVLIADEPMPIAVPQFGLEDATAVAEFLVDWMEAVKREG